MQATVDNRDIPATIRPVPQVRGVSCRRQVPDGIVSHAPRFEEVLERINRVSATNATVLITGETGRRNASRSASRLPSSVNVSHADDSKHAVPVAACPEDGLSAFLNVRPRLFGIAYRMLGSAAEAEDIVQDVWVRWQTTDRSVVRDAPAFLAATATRLAINVLQSAHTRRETSVGQWLPEPVDTNADPGLGAERSEALEFAVLILLEKLSPTERAAYVLREAFDYSYREIAKVLRLEEANTRQLVTRARQHVADSRRARVSSAAQRRLVNAVISAARRGDVAGLEDLFASDVVSTSACAVAA
jgi:RNA polymerase sigma factor (sigma-70 family)